MVAASGILITGLVSSWELIQKFPQSGANGAGSTSSNSQNQPPPTSDSTTRTVTELQTVTVTEYVSGQSTQQASTSQQSAASSQTSQTSSTSSQSVPPDYVLVTPLSALAGKTSAYFNHPAHGLSLLVNVAGQWKAGSANCTHAPCTVQYNGSQIQCPCHGGTFDPNTGAVLGGPPPRPLPQYSVLVQNNNLYVSA
jgi:Rieske Fe-S protein